jgi:predicted restriction endonuclease
MPFWRLKGDVFWQLQNDEHCSPQKGSKEPPNHELIQHDVMGDLMTPAISYYANSRYLPINWLNKF